MCPWKALVHNVAEFPPAYRVSSFARLLELYERFFDLRLGELRSLPKGIHVQARRAITTAVARGVVTHQDPRLYWPLLI